MKHIGIKNNIRATRKEKGMSQRELAEKVGCSYTAINNIELGKSDPTAYTAGLICLALDKKFDEIFYI